MKVTERQTKEKPTETKGFVLLRIFPIWIAKSFKTDFILSLMNVSYRSLIIKPLLFQMSKIVTFKK